MLERLYLLAGLGTHGVTLEEREEVAEERVYCPRNPGLDKWHRMNIWVFCFCVFFFIFYFIADTTNGRM